MPGLMAGALAAHEMFTCCVTAGFTEDQALKIVIAMMTTGMVQSVAHPQPPSA